jgi:hypothetical protein
MSAQFVEMLLHQSMHVKMESIFALEPERTAARDPYFRLADTIEKLTVFRHCGAHLPISADEQAAQPSQMTAGGSGVQSVRRHLELWTR